jgi:hypothetical protein
MTVRGLMMPPQPFLYALPVVGALASEAPGAGGVTVQLDHPVRGQAGPLVEIIDVLGDHAVELSEPPQAHQRVMRRVGLGTSDHREGGAPQLPVAAATGLARHEVLEGELAGIEAVPDATRAAEVRDPGFGAHPGSGEGDDT